MQNYQQISLLSKSAIALAILWLSSTNALAQIEEVIVTAQKREQSLQDVPIAVSAYTREDLEALGANDASDLVNLTPGLSSAQQSRSNRNYFLRGIGTQDFHLTSASAVGQYFDDVTLTSGFHSLTALFDMERVEVLKGPQNTLFGLNTTGGAVNYISKKPEIGAELNGKVKFKVGSDKHLGFDGVLGFGIGDNAAMRFAVHTNKHDGPFKSVTNGVDYGDDDLMAYRAAFLWEPMDRTSFAFNFHGSASKNNGLAVLGLGTRNPDNVENRCSELPDGTLNFGQDTSCVGRSNTMTMQDPADPSTGGWEDVTQDLGFEKISTLGFYAKFDHDFDFATLNLITAFDNLDVQSALDGDGGPTTLLNTQQEDDRDTSQYEVRLVSNEDHAFRWIGGVFYLDEESQAYTGVTSPGIGGGIRVPNVQLDLTKKNLGIYGQFEFDLGERFAVIAGLRWSDEEIVANYLPSSPNAITLLTEGNPIFAKDVAELVRAQFGGAARTNMDTHDENGYEIVRQIQRKIPNKDIGYTLKLNLNVSDDSLIYASYSKGFKGGAADIRAAYALVPAMNVINSLDDEQLEPESLIAYELGYKASFASNKIKLDAAAFVYEYNNLQQFITAGGTPILDNAPESKVSGLDGNLRYGSGGLYLDFGLSLLKTKVTDNGDSTRFYTGAELGNAPSLSFSFRATKEFTIGNGNVLAFSGSANHTGDNVSSTLVTGSNMLGETRTRPAYTIINANATYRFGDNQQFEVLAFVNNLTKERFCGEIGVNEGNKIFSDGPPARALSFNAICRVTRASTRSFGVSFGIDF